MCLDGGRDGGASALGSCFQERTETERQKTLCHGYALRRDSGARPPLHQGTGSIPRRALAGERGDQESATPRDDERQRRFTQRAGLGPVKPKVVTFIISTKA